MSDSPFFRVEMLPAKHGDSLVLEYGDRADAPAHRVLIDGGPDGAYKTLRERLARIPEPRKLDLIVLTHIDGDHIGGILKLLRDDDLGLEFGDLWFNGWPQINRPLLDNAPVEGPIGTRSVLQAAFVGLRMERWSNRWNRSFQQGPIYVHDDGKPPSFELPGGLMVTLLAPSARRLRALRERWEKILDQRHISPDDDAALRELLEKDRRYRGREADAEPSAQPEELPHVALVECRMDEAVANGSSIALIAEFRGRRILLLGDAFIPDVNDALERIAGRSVDRHRFHAIKLAHHGSGGNIDRRFLDQVDCDRFLVSTNGDLFDHPDTYTLELLHRHAPRAAVHLNYPIPHVGEWIRQRQAAGKAVNVVLPSEPGFSVDVMTCAP